MERTWRIAKEMSNLIIYCRSVALNMERIRQKGFIYNEMSSFPETKAEKLICQQEIKFFLKYHQVIKVWIHENHHYPCYILWMYSFHLSYIHDFYNNFKNLLHRKSFSTFFEKEVLYLLYDYIIIFIIVSIYHLTFLWFRVWTSVLYFLEHLLKIYKFKWVIKTVIRTIYSIQKMQTI